MRKPLMPRDLSKYSSESFEVYFRVASDGPALQLFGLDSQLGKRLGVRGGLEARGTAGDPSS